jgi:hypothetical protein
MPQERGPAGDDQAMLNCNVSDDLRERQPFSMSDVKSIVEVARRVLAPRSPGLETRTVRRKNRGK